MSRAIPVLQATGLASGGCSVILGIDEHALAPPSDSGADARPEAASAVESGPDDAGQDASDASDANAPGEMETDGSGATGLDVAGGDSSALPDARGDSSVLPDAGDDSSALPDARGDSSALPDSAADAGGLVTTDHTPTKDAYVRDGPFATMNFGSDVGLAVKIDANGVAGYSRRAWVTFDISQFASITAAKLRLSLTSIDMPDPNDVLVNVYSTPASSNGWFENTINWNNQPVVGPLVASNRVNMLNMGMWVEWDVTSAVQTEVGGMSTFVLEGGGLGSLRLPVFSSREGMNPPVLRITGN